MHRFLFLASLLLIAVISSQQAPRGEITPPGSILAFGMSSCPSGWLAADGVAKSTILYPKLDSALGTTWGAQSGGNFQIPNLASSNRFLRAAGGSLTVGTFQSDATRKTTALVISGGTSSLTGTVTFASDGHTHTAGGLMAAIGAVNGSHRWLGYQAGSPTGPTTTSNYSFDFSADPAHWPAGTYSFAHYTPTWGVSAGNSASASVGISSTGVSLSDGDAETRPTYTAVNYCIKY